MSPEVPQAEYDELRRLIVRDIGQMGSISEPILALLHRLRPRGVKLTAVAMVERQDGAVLCCTRKTDVGLPMDERRVCWPGGHVDPEDFDGGKSFEQAVVAAAIRELREETGLEALTHAASPSFYDIDECGHLCHLVLVHVWRGDLKPEEGTELLWLHSRELMRRAAFPKWYRALADAGWIET